MATLSPLGYAVGGSTVALLAYSGGISAPLSGAVGVGSAALLCGLASFLKIDVPKEVKVEKVSKAAKKAAKKAEVPEELDLDTEEDKKKEKKKAKLQKKKEEEKKKKEEAKAAEEARLAAEAAAAKALEKKAKKKGSAASAPAPAPAPAPVAPAKADKKATPKAPVKEETEEKTKAKKKKSAKKVESEPEVEVEEEQPALEMEGEWSVVPTKRKRENVSAENDVAQAPCEIYVTPEDIGKDGFSNLGKLRGKDMETLKQLQEATQTRIQLPKKDQKQVIVVEGSVVGCQKAARAIRQFLTKGYSEELTPGLCDDGVEVEQESLGTIIGPGGSTLRILQDKTGTEINVPKKDSFESKVSVTGSAQGVAQAIEAINQLVADGFSSLTHPDWEKIEIKISRERIPSLVGAKGANIRAIRDSTRTRIDIHEGTADPATVTVAGTAEDVAAAKEKILEGAKEPDPLPTPPEWSKENTMPKDLWAITA